MAQRDQILMTVIKHFPGLTAKILFREKLIDFEPSGYLTPLIQKKKLNRVKFLGTWRYFPRLWRPEGFDESKFPTPGAAQAAVVQSMIDFCQSGKPMDLIRELREEGSVAPTTPEETPAEETSEVEPEDSPAATELQQIADEREIVACDPEVAEAVHNATLPPEVIERVSQVEKVLDRRLEQLSGKNEELTEIHLNLQAELELLQKLEAKQAKVIEKWEHQKVLQREIKDMSAEIQELRAKLLGKGSQPEFPPPSPDAEQLTGDV